MNTKCKICLDFTLEERADVEQRLINGEKYPNIIKDYPTLTAFTLRRHKAHSGEPKNERDVAAQRLLREQARAKLSDFDCEALIVGMRERLSVLIEESLDMIETCSEDVYNNERPASDLLDSITALQKLEACLENVSGIKSTFDINFAIAKVLREGYKVSVAD